MSDESEIQGGDVYYLPIPGWPEYEISNHGNIRRVSASCGAVVGKSLKWLNDNGYAKVSLCRNAKRVEYRVHRLVAMTFIGEIPSGMDVCHFDGNKRNNAVSNLRIDTRKSNMADQIRMGKTPRGQKCGSNRHAPDLILRIRSLKRDGWRNSKIARELGVSDQYVYNVLKGLIWGWL